MHLLLGFATGLLSLLMGVLFLQGKLRRFEPVYRDPLQPWYFRNIGVAFLPVGIAILAATSAGAVASAAVPGTHIVAIGAAVLALCAYTLAVVWTRWPPEALKPDWMRRADLELGHPPKVRGVARVGDDLVFVLVLSPPVLLAIVGVLWLAR